MSVDFFNEKHKDTSFKSTFGICDDVDVTGNTSQVAYLDERNGANWIAIIDNSRNECISFYPVDNCVTFPAEANGNLAKRCDGVLTCDDTIAFVELKSRKEDGNKWIKEAELQLRSTIRHFEKEKIAQSFQNKRAYAVNNKKPQARTGQATRMERFFDETGYQLFIQARIDIYSWE